MEGTECTVVDGTEMWWIVQNCDVWYTDAVDGIEIGGSATIWCLVQTYGSERMLKCQDGTVLVTPE